MSIRLGSRDSALARSQAEWVAAQLKDIGVEVELILITTHGDQHQGPIVLFEGEGIFTKEIQHALLEGRIDVAVHSLKDLPTTQLPGIELSVVPSRAPVDDALVCRKHASFDELPDGVVIGTSSIRRRAQLLRLRPELHVKEIRGNVPTRLRKLEGGEYDALILAEAGLQRLHLAEKITQRMPLSMFLPAVGQGALGLEIRSNDRAVYEQIAPLNHPATHAAVLAERAMLAALRGGCLAPIAGLGHVEKQQLMLTGRVLSHDGDQMLEAAMTAALNPDWVTHQTANLEAAQELGCRVADALLAQGAATLIEAARQSS